jgi:hypothetical protein
MNHYHYDIDPAETEERHLGWDGQPVFQIHWLLAARPEQPLPQDEFLEVWGDEPGMSEFVNGEPRIGAAQEFDVGCNSNLRVTRVA